MMRFFVEAVLAHSKVILNICFQTLSKSAKILIQDSEGPGKVGTGYPFLYECLRKSVLGVAVFSPLNPN